ncbi:MAG: hypothetical protein WCL38_01750 [Actinomycetota bacterium]
MKDRRNEPAAVVIGIFAPVEKFCAEHTVSRLNDLLHKHLRRDPNLPMSIASPMVQDPIAVSTTTDRLRKIVLVSELPTQRGRRIRSGGR